jgi:hypothetical protein
MAHDEPPQLSEKGKKQDESPANKNDVTRVVTEIKTNAQ